MKPEMITPRVKSLATDGLLIAGGMFNIDPAHYSKTARKAYMMKPVRTNFERALIQGALTRQIQVLGICNGMQVLLSAGA
ncbi:hypothetical protein GOC23_30765 [Sinorhizobium meliloti]|nr:hypothetical protein [Sinorhizobium meliloti]